MSKKFRVSNKGQLIRTRRCRRGQAMDFRVALTSAIAADRASNGFEFQRSLSQHLHWYFPNLGGHTAGCSLRFLFADPSISSPVNSDYTNEKLTSSPRVPGTGKSSTDPVSWNPRVRYSFRANTISGSVSNCLLSLVHDPSIHCSVYRTH